MAPNVRSAEIEKLCSKEEEIIFLSDDNPPLTFEPRSVQNGWAVMTWKLISEELHIIVSAEQRGYIQPKYELLL